MKLSGSDIAKLLELAREAAGQAARHIAREAGKHREVMKKQGGVNLAAQVVTEVDFEAERLILEVLKDSMEKYELGLLTEEHQDDGSRHEKDYFWCIDPLDGTLPFVENVAGYSVSIALVNSAGNPELGVVFDPVELGIHYGMRGGGAFRNRDTLSVDTRHRDRQLTLITDRSFSKQRNYYRLIERLNEMTKELGMTGLKTLNQGGAAMNALWIVQNSPAVYFKFPKAEEGGGSIWDFAATACLFSELDGAVVSDIHGEALQLNRMEKSTFMNRDGILYASNRELAGAVRKLYREFCRT